MDSLPPAPQDVYVYAPGDIYARGAREERLCATASHPDWFYLAGLLALDTAAIWFGSSDGVKHDDSLAVRMGGAVAIGVSWGATVSGAWLALPKCSPRWVASAPREGDVREPWPLSLSLALLAGATAPLVYGIAIGTLPIEWSTFEREMHLVAAGLAGVTGAFLPYLLPPRTWAAAREIDRIRFGADAHGARVTFGFAF